MNTFFSRLIVCLAAILTFASCDKDVNEVGATIVGENHFGFSSDVSSTVLAYTQKTDEVDTSDLLVNQLGIYDSSTFGKTTASVAVELTTGALPVVLTAGATRVVTSVVLDIPYISTDTGEKDIFGAKIYSINNIVGDKNNKFKLSIFRSTKDIAGVFPTTSLNNRYFSNTTITTSGSRYNDFNDIAQNDEFFFNPSPNSDAGPSMKLDLNNSLGTDILSLGTTALSSDANFRAVFKGLFFKVEQSGINPGCMSLLNFTGGKLTIKYDQTVVEAGTNKELVLTMTGRSVNVLEQANSSDYNNRLNTPNTTSGDDRLYLKGGNGSVAYINLFGNTNVVAYDRLNNKIVPRVAGDANDTPDELDYLKAKGLIINEANLIFTVDNAAMGSSIAPARIFIYNANNKKQLIDYNEDNTINPLKGIHDGIIQKVTGSNDKYRIRVTNHIRNLINKDSTNVRLAVAVTRDISAITFNANKNASYLTGFQWSGLPVRDRLDFTAKFFPVSSISSPLGTVLYGSNVSAADNDKKLKLEIWYTKPN